MKNFLSKKQLSGKNMQYTSLGQEEKDKGVKTEWQIVYN